MFQVASAQPHNFAAGPVQQSQQQMPAKSLPRRLARPEFKQPNPKIIAAVNPELANVPIEYIRRGLADMGTDLCNAINRVAPMLPSQPPANHLVNLNLPPSSNSNRLPTHILALQSTRSDQKFLYPTHALLLAAYCTGVPPVPILPPGSTSLPVVQLKVTSPNLFPVLQVFLLTKSYEALISGILPVSASSLASFASLPPPQRTAKLGHMLYEKSRGSMQQLMAYSDQISAFWRLICALGVFDNDTWEVVDLAWDAVLGAMNLVIQNEDAGRGRRM